jgi:hypothetical protein
MAFIAKNVRNRRPGRPVLSQWLHVARTTALVPQSGGSATDIIFRVFGGRVLVHLLIGEVTTVISGTDPVLKVSSKKLDGTPAAVGTAVDVAST